MRDVVVLGATGSVGRSALNVLGRHPDRFRVVGITARRNARGLDELAVRHEPRFVVLAEEPDAGHDPRWDGEWRFGAEAVTASAGDPEAEIVVNGLVGVAGLAPTLEALSAGKRLALANKESLVAGGPLVLRTLREGGGELLPVDSEHSAVHQCIQGRSTEEVSRVVLTASGGPFRRTPAEDFDEIGPEDALRHPTWEMGRKITVDSATLANKALEVIEAHHLFGLTYDQIDVVVHPDSIVHCLVEFRDGSVLSQLGEPDMEVPILHALAHPELPREEHAPFDPVGASPLTFEHPRTEDFPMLELGIAAGRQGGLAPAVYNAANEVAVEAFLAGQLPFPEIPRVVEEALRETPSGEPEEPEQVWDADRSARRRARAAVDGSRSPRAGGPQGTSGVAATGHEADDEPVT